MPTSEHWQIPRVVDAMLRVAPRTVLDVGAGYGKYGVLAREYARPERVDAVDANPPRYPVYDHVWLGDVRELERLLPEGSGWDLALFVDTLEHLEKDEGWALLDRLTVRARRVIVTTPWGFRRQEIPGQPYETHRSGWLPWEFGRRFRVEHLEVFPGHYTRWLRLPRLWQILAVLARR
jgi:hypothetical protein